MSAAEEDRALTFIDLQPGVLLARQQEVADIRVGLQTDDVGSEQAVHDLLAHIARQDFPVLRRRPRDVDEMLEHRVR